MSDDADDALTLALGGLDPEAVLGARVEKVLFTSGNLSRVVGVRTVEGGEVVVKSRPDSSRLEGVLGVQRTLHGAGQPVPEPLGTVHRRDGRAISVERLVLGGEHRGPAAGAASDFAAVFHDLVRAAPGAAQYPSLRDDPPAWVNWGDDASRLWPQRDSPGGEIRSPGPADVDDAGRDAAEVLRALDREPVLVHADFEDQNIRWHGTRIHVVHDWDSLAPLPECAAVGAVAAIWPAGVVAWCATTEQAADFIAAYEHHRGAPFDAVETKAAWAAALWHRAFNARKDAADGGGTQLDLFRRDVAALRARAGLG
jgi:hypothetical protein